MQTIKIYDNDILNIIKELVALYEDARCPNQLYNEYRGLYALH